MLMKKSQVALLKKKQSRHYNIFRCHWLPGSLETSTTIPRSYISANADGSTNYNLQIVSNVYSWLIYIKEPWFIKSLKVCVCEGGGGRPLVPMPIQVRGQISGVSLFPRSGGFRFARLDGRWFYPPYWSFFFFFFNFLNIIKLGNICPKKQIVG